MVIKVQGHNSTLPGSLEYAGGLFRCEFADHAYAKSGINSLILAMQVDGWSLPPESMVVARQIMRGAYIVAVVPEISRELVATL